MKYIRTKDGVYEFQSYNEQNDYYWLKGLSEPISKEEILNQSENLKELCDMFVYCKRGFYEIYRQLDFAHYDKEYIKNGGTIKGAIWTSKGLIYVAKMDDKGDLELI